MTIYLVGTSHVASESRKKVKDTILEKRPGCVAVELDFGRYMALKSKDDGSGRGVKMPVMQKLIFSMLRNMQKELSHQTNVMPGDEMLAAVEYAKEVGAEVAFIDQDVNVTMRRLMKKLGFFGQLKLLFFIVVGMLGIPVKGMFVTKEFDLDSVPDEDFIEYAMGELKVHFPPVYTVLVDERNHVMARNLRALGERFDDVVAVVGAGHVKGIGKLLEMNKS